MRGLTDLLYYKVQMTKTLHPNPLNSLYASTDNIKKICATLSITTTDAQEEHISPN